MNHLLCTAVLALSSVGFVCSQTAVVTRNVNLRPDPSTNGSPIDKLTPPAQLQLLEAGATNGFLHVIVNGNSGWMWSKNVKVQQTSTTTTGSGGPEEASTTTISPDWDKPAPQVASFASEEGTCGETGDGGDTDTNRRKNRTDVPPSYHAVTWNAINTLDYAKHAPKSRMDWTSAQLATITPVEGAAITVEGYLYTVKVESSSASSTSGGESTNCHAHLANDVDWHMPLTAHLGDGEDLAIIVETTPRVRRQHAQWTTAHLKPWASHIGSKANASYNKQKVRISGWLMLDPEHQDMITEGLRSTLWEIHPITKIEVWNGGQWVDLDTP